MNDAFRAMLDAMLADYGAWSKERSISGCRWVQYTGVEMTGAMGLPLDEVASGLENAVCEGFRVDWAEHEGRLYVRVWEGEDEPAWDKVFAEESLADVSEILRRAGFRDA